MEDYAYKIGNNVKFEGVSVNSSWMKILTGIITKRYKNQGRNQYEVFLKVTGDTIHLYEDDIICKVSE